MKLTRGERVYGGMRRMANWIALAAMAVLSWGASAQGVSTTTVQGTVYLANGQPGAGTLVLSWPAFTTAAGQAIAADQLTVTIAADGFVSVNLAPNQGATPAGEYYTATYYMSDGSSSTEYWVVPAAASATLAQVQAQVMPAAQAVQAVSKAYVDQSIAELQESLLSASGGDLSGPLYLNGDPTQPLQAADKHYVDTQVATAVPLSGATMTGPLMLSADPTQPMQAADKEYVDAGTANAWPALVLRVDEYAGADFGARLQACLNAVSPTYGGTCDARNFTGSQTMSAGVTISTANTTVLLPCATISTASQIVVTAGTRNGSLRGCALRGGSAASGSQGGTALVYSGAGALIQVGDPTCAVDTPGFHLDNVVIDTTAATSASAKGLVAYRTQELDLESVYFLGSANQTGMTLDGTGNYTGGTFLDDQFDGFQTAVNAIGHQVANPATTDWMNASSFVRLHIDCPTSSGNPIAGTYGINLQQGDGNTFTGGDVEGCATALHLGANAQNNTIVGLRNENSTSQVVADAGSSYNSWIAGGTLFTGQLTDNGTRNSFQDSFHRSLNGLNGDWYGSQQDATLTNHYRLGIGSGNERGLLNRYQTDYGYRWTMGLSDATGGEQFYQVLDELNNVYRLSIGQYNNGQSSTNNQTVINSAGSGAVVLNGSNNGGTGGVVIGSGGASAATVASISNAGNAQFNGSLQVGGTAQFAGTPTVRNNADAEVDYFLWPGLTTSQKGSFTYKDWNGNSQWYLLKDASNNWALNSAVGGLDSFKAYQSTNSGDTYVNASNSAGTVRVNYETGSGAAFKVYGGNSNTLYASFTGATAIEFPGLAAGSGHDCLQIDTSGYVTNTGVACGSGSGGSGTVNSSTAGYIAYYTANGTVLGGTSSVPVTAGGTGAASAAGALASLGALPAAGGTLTGALNGTSASFSGNVAEQSELPGAPPILDIRNPAFAGGAVCDGATDIGPALQAAVNALPSNGGEIQIVGNPTACYWANPTTLNWGSHATITLFLQGELRTGTTLLLPPTAQTNFIGKSAAGSSQFQAPGETASLIESPLSGSSYGTLGTAVSTTAGTAVSVTFTPSTMTGLYPGTAITVAGTLTCSISAITRANNQVTATLASSCHIPAGVPLTIAGVTDSSFNGAYAGGAQPQQFLATASDYVLNTLTWNQTGSAGSSSGGTVTGFNEDTTEDVQITATTSTTATATFYRPHTASDQWGVVALDIDSNNNGDLIRDLSIIGSGAGIWLQQSYLTRLEKVGVTSPGACGGQIANQGVDFGLASLTKLDGVAFDVNCLPWSVHVGQPYFSGYAGSGSIFIDNSFLTGGGVKLDHGGVDVYIHNTDFEQLVRGAVTWDPSNFWSGNPQQIHIDNSAMVDNANGYAQCWVYYLTPSYQGNAQVSNVLGSSSCLANDYVLGGLKSDTPTVAQFNLNQQRGIPGVHNDGIALEGELRGEGAGMGPSLIPYATSTVTTNPSGWSGACTVATGVEGPDGTLTAGSLTSSTSQQITVGGQYGLTPAVGDMILFGGWVYSPTHGATDEAGPSGTAFDITNNGSSHWSLSVDGYVSNVQAMTNPWDSNIVDDWWHPLVGFARVVSSDGTGGQYFQFRLSCGPGGAMNYWMPWMMYIPASAGYSMAEVMRWRQQLLHAAVPSNYNGPGTPATIEPIATGGYSVLSSAGGAPIQIVPPTASLPYVGFKTYAGTGSPSDTCSATANAGAIEISATPTAYQCSNATGSYAWNALGGTGTVTDGSGTSTAGLIAESTSTAHQVQYSSALPGGTTAATQTAGDNSTKVATTAYVATPGAIAPTTVTASGLVTGANDAVRTSSTTMTNSWTTTGLVLPSVPASTTKSGRCVLYWQMSSTSYTATFGLGMNNAPTDVWGGSSVTYNANGSSNWFAFTQSSASTTAISAASTAGAANTTYRAEIDFTLQTGSSNAVAMTVYGETSNAGATLTIEPGSVCYWLP